MESTETEPGDVMECLIQHKRDPEMNDKCRAGIEHHQLVSLKVSALYHRFQRNENGSNWMKSETT